MSESQNPVMTSKRPATAKKRFIAALSAAAATGATPASPTWKATAAAYAGRHGKHNGRTKGAFGQVSWKRRNAAQREE